MKNNENMTPEEICVAENRVMIGKYFCIEGVPHIELIVPRTKYDDEDIDNVIGTKLVYLSAFRRYCFQVSATRDGDWNLGSGPVFGLETFTTITQTGCSNLSQESTVKYIISCVAMDAIRDYCNGGYGNGLNMPSTKYGKRAAFHGNPEWDRFIDETLKFCRHEKVESTMTMRWEGRERVYEEVVQTCSE